MKLYLKQAEIIDALKQFVAKQGFSLTGKSVDIAFTAGRKESGLSAEVSIEDVEIPGLEDAPVAAVKPALSVVATIAPVANAAVLLDATTEEVAVQEDPPFEADAESAPAVVQDAPVVKTASLFN